MKLGIVMVAALGMMNLKIGISVIVQYRPAQENTLEGEQIRRFGRKKIYLPMVDNIVKNLIIGVSFPNYRFTKEKN